MKLIELILESPKVTSKFGYRIHPISKKKTFHNGVDYISKTGSRNIKAVEDGYVHIVHKGTTGYGNYVWVRYPRINRSLLHAHLKSISVKKGDKVTKGTLIGIEGTTGNSTGVHLHLGMTEIGKSKWLDAEAYDYTTESKYNLLRPLKKGCKGADVKKLQAKVGTRQDGVFGNNTKAKLKVWQKNRKLSADGICGKNTAHSFGWLYKGK